MKIPIKKKNILSESFCALICVYYTLKGWKYATRGLEIILMVAVFCALALLVKKCKLYMCVYAIPIVTIVAYKLSLGSDTRPLIDLLAVFVGTTVPFEQIAKWLLKVKCITFVLAFMIGGYIHLNYLSMNIGVIMALVLYVYYPRNRRKALFFGLMILIVGTLISKSGSMVICGGILLLLYAGQTIAIERKVLLSHVMYFMFPLTLILNWLLAALYAKYGYGSQKYALLLSPILDKYSVETLCFLNRLNRFLSGRINLAAFSLEKFGTSFWGGNIDYTVETGLPYFLVDSGMILLLQNWGLLITLVSMFVWIFLMRNLVKKKNIRLIISAIMIALWSFNEDTLMSVGTNFLFYAIGNELVDFYKRKKTSNEDYRFIYEVGRIYK